GVSSLVRAVVLVGWVFERSSHIADGGGDDARHLPKRCFDSPEAPCTKTGCLHDPLSVSNLKFEISDSKLRRRPFAAKILSLASEKNARRGCAGRRHSRVACADGVKASDSKSGARAAETPSSDFCLLTPVFCVAIQLAPGSACPSMEHLPRQYRRTPNSWPHRNRTTSPGAVRKRTEPEHASGV